MCRAGGNVASFVGASLRSLTAIRSSQRAGTFLALLLALNLMGQAPQLPGVASASPALAATAAAKPPWGRIIMVGASVSAGFTLSEPFGGSNTPQYRLSRYVDAALRVPHEPVQNLGNALFFLAPEAEGRRQIEAGLKAQPTLMVAVDFPFWFCYGNVRTNEDRLQRFEQGLKLLEKVQCPLVIGDIPDASAAANGILSESQIPSVEVMAAANRRLKEWSATRPQVAIVALSEFMRAAMANQPVTVHNHIWPAGRTRALLQEDKLHPSPSGCVALALAVLDAGLAKPSGPSANEVRWDPEEVLRLVSVMPQ